MIFSTRSSLRSAAVGLAALVTAGCSTMGARSGSPIKHVFVIVLENQGYDTTFGLHLTPAQKADLVEYLKTL